ncbi:MAG: hypothetical protein BroJett021_41720 [Chloroflexota bacterium]|nr:hypothetical protein [Caldilinea sp.]GIK75184.1 MAG: hypothetical protein BroJett021_41720 [Chloroflexota bacterium]
MNQWWDEWVVRPFIRTLTEVAWFGPVVIAILVSLLVNMFTEALTTWGGVAFGFLVWIFLAAITISFVYGYNWVDRRRRGRGLGTPADRKHPSKYAGLVFLFSREDTLREAIQHHRPALQHCWLIVTPQMQPAALKAANHFDGIQFSIEPLSDLYDTRACFDIVCNIFEQKAGLLHITPAHMVADITGGTKPMTVGLILACIEHGVAIQHVPTAYDVTGKPGGPLSPIVIELTGGD